MTVLNLSSKGFWYRLLVTYLQIYGIVATPVRYKADCTIKISEVFVPVDSEGMIIDDASIFLPFIELQACFDATDFSSFKNHAVIFVDLHEGRIYDYIDINHLKIGVTDVVPENHEFLVISDDDDIATNVGILDSRDLRLRECSTTGILLVKKSGSFDAYNFVTDGSEVSWSLLIDEPLYALLKNSIVDAVVISSANDNLKDIEKLKYIVPIWKDLDYHIEYYDQNAIRSYSFNRCSNVLLDITKFQIEIPTPGRSNRCPKRVPLGSREPLGLELLTNARSNDFIYQCPMLQSDNTYLETFDEFPVEWTEEIRSKHLDSFTAVFSNFLNSEDVRKSIIYLSDSDAFRCETCYTSMMFKNPNWKPNDYTSPVIQKGGVSLLAWKDMYRKMRYHFSTDGHKNNVRCIESERSDSNTPAESDSYYQKTGMLLFWTFVETKAGTSLISHEIFTAGLKEMGVDIARHYFDRNGATKIVQFLSTLIHLTMVKNLCFNNEPFGVLIDGSTDVSGRHGMLVFLQYIEFNRPVVKLYRYLETKGEKAIDLFNLLREAVRKDGPCFEKYFFARLRSINTDGASNMVGKWQGLSKLIEKEAKRKIQNIHCSNHRLELAYNDVLKNKDKKFDFVRSMESINNRIHIFYNRRAYKRRSNLRDTGSILDESITMFSRIFKVRWFTSTYFAYTKIVSNYKSLVADQKKYIDRTVYQAALDVRVEAQFLLNTVTNKEYLLTINHHLDVLEVMSSWALYLQRASGTIIDVKIWYDTVIENLEALKTVDGKWVKSLLDESTCGGQKGCTMMAFTQNNDVIYKGVKLESDPPIDNLFPKLSDTRVMFLEEIIKDISNRFPDNVLEMYSLLIPQTLSTVTEVPTNMVNYINDMFGYDKEVIKIDVLNLIKSITATDFYARYVNDPPEIFWPNALNKDFEWTEITREIVKSGLVTAVGNARVESAFSSLKIIKDPNRSKLSITMVEHLLRIKINTSDNLAEFPKIPAAKQWLKSNHIRSDDPRETPKHRNRKRKNRNYILPSLNLIPDDVIDPKRPKVEYPNSTLILENVLQQRQRRLGRGIHLNL